MSISVLGLCVACHAEVPDKGSVQGDDGDLYCSEWCFRTRTPEATAELTPKEVFPLWRGMMQAMCKVCPRDQKTICLTNERPLSFAGTSILNNWKTMQWENKIQEVFGGALSDGGVPHEEARRVVSAVEQKARDNGNNFVGMNDAMQVMLQLTEELDYRPPRGVDPEFQAAIDSLPSTAKSIEQYRREGISRTEVQRATPEAQVAQAQGMKDSLAYHQAGHELVESREAHWCGHLPHFFARLTIQPGYRRSKADELLAAAEEVAAERGHPGVTPRDVNTAWFRAVASQLTN